VAAINPIPSALSIAGSDPGGGAGIQADLKTFSQLRVHGMAVIAALTAQNSLGVSSVAEVSPDFVAQQLDAVLADMPPHATKTGMLLTEGVIETVAQRISHYGVRNLVVDPVMIATSGAQLMNMDAITTFRRKLLPLAFLVTPNTDEATTLTGSAIHSLEDMEEAALRIHDMGASHVLIKGGHLLGDEATDILFDGQEFSRYPSVRLAIPNTHGTGCVLSAAITAYLAIGMPLRESVRLGKEFVTNAIRKALRIGKGAPACNPLSLGE
jgi:hydroxymethylpyrimidine/phosphomethylpyrimidine kinase